MRHIYVGATVMALSLLCVFSLTFPQITIPLGKENTTILFGFFCFTGFLSLPIMLIGSVLENNNKKTYT